MKTKVQLHTAAVTCIVDLQDGIHLATASYDRKINIFNHRRGVAILSALSSKAGIGCMALAGDKTRLITAALDSSLAVWILSRDVLSSSYRLTPSPTSNFNISLPMNR
jgi:WD40 repeat protein